ncbi:zinc carboxypeptidase-like [Pectinophora gossypiella]|uniref:zinc carboxypeptidase-like n=1 Tax=Pectinophora gossypiella TaxID=13191 RepID=UPI00214ED401|nr:zinc carboxypeptidase-like [Pectinophora gossypiella]
MKNYSDYTLFRNIPLSEPELEFMKKLNQIFDVDFWRWPGTVNKPIDVMIGPKDRDDFKRMMDERQYYYTTVIPNIQRVLDEQTVKNYTRRKMDTFDWKSYFRLADIYEWIHDLSKARPKEVKLITIGTTYENRKLLGLQVILRGSKRRSAVIVEGGIHAREWIAPAFVTYMMNQIVNSDRSSNLELKHIALLYEWYFLPVVNPDGYEYSHSQDRMWRKNRRQGHGVDINRNFDSSFGGEGVSRQKNSEIYCGEYAFSEKESEALANFIRLKSEKLEYYLAFHSYGQCMIIPYAYSKGHFHNFDEVRQKLSEAHLTLTRKYGTRYSIGTAYDTVGYMTSGVSGCWAKQVFKVPYVATFELRDTGQHGFALPPQYILPTCEETMDGLLTFLKPKTLKFVKLSNAQTKKICNVFAFIFNLLFFIIARFD